MPIMAVMSEFQDAEFLGAFDGALGRTCTACVCVITLEVRKQVQSAIHSVQLWQLCLVHLVLHWRTMLAAKPKKAPNAWIDREPPMSSALQHYHRPLFSREDKIVASCA